MEENRSGTESERTAEDSQAMSLMKASKLRSLSLPKIEQVVSLMQMILWDHTLTSRWLMRHG